MIIQVFANCKITKLIIFSFLQVCTHWSTTLLYPLSSVNLHR